MNGMCVNFSRYSFLSIVYSVISELILYIHLYIYFILLQILP